MKFKIATPERVMLDTEVDSVTLPTTLGEITVLPNHIPLVANLAAGEIIYKQNGKENFFAVSGGVIEVKKHSDITVLADSAEFGHEIDLTRAEAGREAAKKLMSKPMDEKSFVDTARWLERTQARIKVAKKHHTRKQTGTGDQ
jgi:F-type H+-transporting ATPase subunit epsilon